LRSLETDYLVVGAGAMGMAFTDALVDHADVHVTLVDRRHAAGGHWQDAYPLGSVMSDRGGLRSSGRRRRHAIHRVGPRSASAARNSAGVVTGTTPRRSSSRCESPETSASTAAARARSI
jgi:NAD(P)-binding Rossmann-like domain